jgi:hypothetical protein
VADAAATCRLIPEIVGDLVPRFYSWLAASIARSRWLMWALIASFLVGLPLAAVFKSAATALGVGLLWLVLMVVVWFEPRSFSRLTNSRAWMYALAVDFFLFVLVTAVLQWG